MSEDQELFNKVKKKTAKELIVTEVLDARNLRSKKRVEELRPLLNDFIKNTLKVNHTVDSYLEELKASKSRVIVARYGGKPIGFNIYEMNVKRNRPEPTGIYVKREFRGKGVSSKLMRKTLYDVRMRGQGYPLEGVILSKEGKNVLIKRRSQWREISKIPQSIFEKAKKRRRKGR